MPSVEKAASANTAFVEELRALVLRVTQSQSFAKSERLSTLLVHICDRSLEGKAKELNEQKIGVAVFGRRPDYDSSADGIVRTQASRLRKQLELYFRDEGAHEPITIVIPRGGYLPSFEPRAPAENASSPTPTSQEVLPPPLALPAAAALPEPAVAMAEHSRKFPRYGAALLVLLLGLGFLLWHRLRDPWPARSSSTQNFWTGLLAGDKEALVVVGDSGLVMWHGTTAQPLGLAEYMHGAYRNERSADLEHGLASSDLSNRRYTSVVDLEIVHAVDQIAMRMGRGVEVRFARDIHPNDLKHSNVVLLGAPEANPWVEMYDPRLNFFVSNDRVHQVMSVLNRAPKAGEPRQWDSAKLDLQHRVFGVVAYLPNIDGSGSALLLEGTSMAGTESCWDFLSSEDQLQQVLQQMGGSGTKVPYFEAVIGTNSLDGSAAKIRVLAWRKL